MKISSMHRGMRLKEKEINQKKQKCPFCGSIEREFKLTIQGYPEVNLLKCNHCYACSASSMPKQSTLDKYYSSYYDDNHQSITFNNPERFGKHLYQYSKLSLKGNISILDFGGGNGRVSYEAAKSLITIESIEDITIEVVDYFPDVITPKVPGITIGHIKELSEIESNIQYDFVIASAIIEHIPEGGKALQSLFKRLKPGGIFYARTPYMSDLKLLILKDLDLTYPAHVHDLGRKFWNNISGIIDSENQYEIIRSTPAIVEDSFSVNFFRTLAAYILKSLWYLFRFDKFTGGWEIFLRKRL
jgi:2-polyprenyl-3-methyl-5-hydroxy-6-metoxy-1,4-benzoquinol methylase